MLSRRMFSIGAATLGFLSRQADAQTSFRLGLTPVFLDNDSETIDRLRTSLSYAAGMPVTLVQKRTYQEVTGLLLEGGVDAAWLCGYPFLQHRDELSLVAVPLWQGTPTYRSYLITSKEDQASGLTDLRGGAHAFSDPNSNSGYLVTASDLARNNLRPEQFFSRIIFTYGHRNVVRAVAGGLVRSGSVDGYVWEALTKVEPELTDRTRVISRSEPLGFPPFCARTDRIGEPDLAVFQAALLQMTESERGRDALTLLQLDGMIRGEVALFDGILTRMQDLAGHH
ncbi:phosphonate transport system substrate-binding protein [Paracoccus saliphilus]|uniref:PhnD/SsuA/transferrin family substrate-binding protein n=2 Tax=Paracoccus saliphilus TaxID=405559 RepID=A0AA46A7G3_9RHOB|nr:PhnD/SsuA/transferrin family substrate-binding protein [Paracoccus saliphilus]SIT13068.1 phosphonate transport system substrate-binding protein [Paracoccus saliphilus]